MAGFQYESINLKKQSSVPNAGIGYVRIFATNSNLYKLDESGNQVILGDILKSEVASISGNLYTLIQSTSGSGGAGSTTAISSINGLSSQSLIISGSGAISVYTLNSNTIIINGNVTAASGSQSSDTILAINTFNGLNIIDEFPISTNIGAEWFTVMTSGSNLRALKTISCFNTQGIEYTNYYSNSLGIAGNVIVYANISGSNIQLLANSPQGYTIKSLRKLI
jgi:hypothetical protein